MSNQNKLKRPIVERPKIRRVFADERCELFDAVVISAEAGMRKPEPRIFLHATTLLGLEPAECIFIDDIEANVLAAEAVGMVGVHHRGLRSTTQRLSELLGIPLDGLPA